MSILATELWGCKGRGLAENAVSIGVSSNALSPTKRALLAIQQLQAKLAVLEQAGREPIAIIGASCRLPGGADSPAAFWQMLQSKVDAIAPNPKDRWPSDYYSANPTEPGKVITQQGGFIPHLYDFDAAFFRISPREAVTLDPQQRLALELGWEALEQAGIAPDGLVGQAVGVFLGISSIDHWQQVLARSPETIDAYLGTGNSHSVAAGRLSYLLGVSGPSLAIDTACSSSLVAVHLACQSLRQQECDMALAGGVNRIITPAASINFSKAKMLSADGRCRTFDQAASGFGRAEGGGMVVLKRLSDAQAAGDRISAVILGSAVNHNGRSNGLTAPSTAAQQAVIRQALKVSNVAPETVNYIETHGTGTVLGDPMEVAALSAVFGESESSPGKQRERPLVLGAAKTNIGHAEAAAGIAGLIKAVLAIEQGQIPANLHLNTPNSEVDWANLPFELPHSTLPWPEQNETPRTAGVSAFGFSGTNAHLVLQAPPVNLTTVLTESTSGLNLANPKQYLLPLSARTPAALNRLVALYAQYLAAHLEVNLINLCFTASVGRSHFSTRLAIIGTSPADLRQILISVLAGRDRSNCWKSEKSAAALPVEEPHSLTAYAVRYTQGETLDWTAIYQQIHVQSEAAHPYQKIVLPTYPFERLYYGPDAL